MYDIRQFRPTVQLLLALGFTGFAIATLAPLIWVFAIAMLLLHGWLVKRDRFVPLPRWAANGLTLAAAVWTAVRITDEITRPIFPIGNFLVILQIIKLFELRGNRDYAQLLVLSVLLMVSAIISTASLLFGITFIAYVLLCPYVSLLFHLKVETDHAKRQMGLDERLADPLTLRQDQRFLHRSMSRLTALVAAVAVTMAVVVFLFFPRVPGAGMLTWQFRPSMASTGMSEQMDMKSVTRVQQNTVEIGSVRITHNGVPVTSGEMYFRGAVYDVYDGAPESPARWSWERALQRGAGWKQMRPWVEEVMPPNYVERPDDDQWVQDFEPLKPTGVSFLVALGGVTHLSVANPLTVGFQSSPSSLVLRTSMTQAMYYRVVSTGVVPYEARRWRGMPFQNASAEGMQRDPRLDADLGPNVGPNARRLGPTSAPTTWPAQFPRSTIDPRIEQYARRPEVSGVDARGKSLASFLPSTRVVEDPSPLAAEIARNIERHLQTQFTYTLDVGDDRTKDDVTDPIVHFLYDAKSGWCEHYASAMTLMCQSLGINARLVSGYKCDEYNAVGGWFVLRQSHAHAWVEVLVRENGRLIWQTFDPTSGISNDSGARIASTWTKLGHVFDYLEHAWANSVVAFDASSQSSLFDAAQTKLVNMSGKAQVAVHDGGSKFSLFSDWMAQAKYTLSEGAIIILVILMVMIAIGLIAGYSAQRLRLTRRARRIGLDTLDGAEARRLARQLGFYDELTRILERRAITRPSHQTPLEFGHSLTFLPYEPYQTVVRLTNIFYRIRFGNARLSAGRRRSLSRVIDRLQQQLMTAKR